MPVHGRCRWCGCGRGSGDLREALSVRTAYNLFQSVRASSPENLMGGRLPPLLQAQPDGVQRFAFIGRALPLSSTWSRYPRAGEPKPAATRCPPAANCSGRDSAGGRWASQASPESPVRDETIFKTLGIYANPTTTAPYARPATPLVSARSRSTSASDMYQWSATGLTARLHASPTTSRAASTYIVTL